MIKLNLQIGGRSSILTSTVVSRLVIADRQDECSADVCMVSCCLMAAGYCSRLTACIVGHAFMQGGVEQSSERYRDTTTDELQLTDSSLQ